MLFFCGILIKSHIFFAWDSISKTGKATASWAEMNISKEDGRCAHGLTQALRWLGSKAVDGDKLSRIINEQFNKICKLVIDVIVE